jgi:hypothetical protein
VSRLDWSRKLPRPLTIPTVMKLDTLADVRDLVEKHLPEQYRRKPGWRHVSNEMARLPKATKTCRNLRVTSTGAGARRRPMPDEVTPE